MYCFVFLLVDVSYFLSVNLLFIFVGIKNHWRITGIFGLVLHFTFAGMLQTAFHRSNKTTRCRRDECSQQLVAAGSTLFESLLQAQTLAKAGLIRQRGEANHTCHHPNRNADSKIKSVWFDVTFPNIECCQHCVGSPRRTTYVSQVVIFDKFLARQACKSIYLGIPSFSSSVPGAPEIPEEIAVQVDCQPPMMFWARLIVAIRLSSSRGGLTQWWFFKSSSEIP